MSEIYQFQCQDCDFEFKVKPLVESNCSTSISHYFCEKCCEISSSSKCKQCGNDLQRAIFSLEEDISNIDEENNGNKLKCPNCFSDNTILTLLDDWGLDYQIW